jgi:hypothetical protein
MTLLGHTIRDGAVWPLDEKIRKLRDTPRPNTGEGLATFLGLMVYVSQQLPHASTLAAPLHQMRKTGKLDWTPVQIVAFNQCKDAADNALPIYPIDYGSLDRDETYLFVRVDASPIAVGGYIAQGKTVETAILVKLHSRKFTTFQQNYDTREKENLAIYSSIMAFQQYLIGYYFTVITDHELLNVTGLVTIISHDSCRKNHEWEQIMITEV